MKAAILCPGPSLSHYGAWDQFDLLIGVNRAALKVPVHVWACGDFPLIMEVSKNVLGSPSLLTKAHSATWLRENLYPWRGKVFEFEQMHDGSERRVDWPRFTAAAAAKYAASRGATVIRAYGMDWKGTADFDGRENAVHRSDSRWESERYIWNKLAQDLNSQGVTMLRVVPENA